MTPRTLSALGHFGRVLGVLGALWLLAIIACARTLRWS